jgi:hypothetical protein
MERIRRGFRLLGASWEVVKADRELLVLPLVSFLAIAIVGAATFGVIAADGIDVSGESVRMSMGDYIVTGVFYFVMYFIGIFFSAAVVGAATIRLQGGDPTIGDGLRMAWSKLPKIAGWSVVAASVGLVLRALEERAGFLGRIVIVIVGAAWNAITFFVIPVLLYEPESVPGSVKRSATIFKERWGEQFVGNGAIGIAMFLLSIPAFILAGELFAIAPVVGIVAGVVVFGLLIGLGGAMSGVFNAALYRYATTGEASGAFTEQDLGGSFVPKKR